MNQFGCPFSKDPRDRNAGTGNPPDGAFTNLASGATERRFNGGNIKDEFTSEDSNEEGTLSMANTGAPDSGGSQFFINVNDNDGLDWFSEGASRHPVFGRITSGLELCVAISRVPTNDDNPKAPIRMDSVVISNVPARG
jgi:cyclophilin family peptidyl-prolyl cis-trans isomerase